MLVVCLLLGYLPFAAAVRTFTVYNGCPFTIWPAIYTDLSTGSLAPQFQTGWQASAYTSVSFAVPDNWTSGRIWGRRDCTFPTGNTSASTCLDGGCNGGLLCDSYTGTGTPPATLAEWTLGGTTGTDYYDVSIVDGYNLPLSITPTSGCPVAECPWDLGPLCPAPLAGPFDSTGFPVGCKSACVANLDGDPSNSPNCCSGNYSTPQTCPNTGVAYYWFFKGYCPLAYAYPFDESSGTALWNCPATNLANYTLTFCPPNDASSSSISTQSTPSNTNPTTTFAIESSSWSPGVISSTSSTSSSQSTTLQSGPSSSSQTSSASTTSAVVPLSPGVTQTPTGGETLPNASAASPRLDSSLLHIFGRVCHDIQHFLRTLGDL